MKLSKLIYRSLVFYKKQHLALLIGTIISTAVLTGALIVGDSVRGSLQELVDMRLGNASYVLQTGDRFVTADLSNHIAQEMNVETASVLLLNGIGINPDTNKRVNKIQVLGMDNDFWKLADLETDTLNNDEAFISQNVADKLQLDIGDEFLLKVENAEIIPLNAPFAEEKESTVSFRLQVKKILSDNELGRFSLKSDQKAPYNVFVNQNQLSRKLELEGLVNTILVENSSQINIDKLNLSIKNVWQIQDVGLTIRELSSENRIEVLSDRIFIDEPIAKILESLNPKEQILTYLVNSINKDSAETPYSFVSAISGLENSENEISINNWLAEDLHAKVGDSLEVTFFIIGPLRKLQETSTTFIVKDIKDIDSGYFQKSFMPEFPGLADAGSCSDWNTGIPIDLDKIRDKDEDYWDDYKGTPKAIISFSTGQKLWSNQYGQYTSFRFEPKQFSKEDLEKKILEKLKPKDLNLFFRNIRSEGQTAAKNSVDFGELFLSLSFFVILAGILLTILLFALNTASRMQETAIFAALGFTKKQILKIRISESTIMILLGSVLGVVVGVFYNQLLLKGLNSVWQGAVHTNMLDVYLKPATLFIGGFSGILISFISIFFVLRKQLKNQLSRLLKKDESKPVSKKRKINWLRWLGFAAFAAALGLIIPAFLDGIEKNASSFLTGGFLILLDFVIVISGFIRKRGTGKSFSKNNLVFKNLNLNHKRNMATIALLALGTFSVIITGSNRKTFYGVENENSSGTGGYQFWMETTTPVLYDLNTEKGIQRYGFDSSIFKNVEFLQLKTLEGNDASCLNLNLVQNPGILGVNTKALSDRNSFSFTKILGEPLSENPWLSLNHFVDSNIYDAMVDQTVLTWGLMKEVGDTLFYTDEFGQEIGLRIRAGLKNSIFQGHVLVSEEVFKKHFPSVSGSKIMLVDCPEENKEIVNEAILNQLIDLGVETTPTSQRLAEFNTVTNSYLTVFMMLGGLGILIGTFGLGIVLIRNLLDRKYELALLKALGYRQSQIFRIVFSENLIILTLGLLSGLFAAIIGMIPSFLSPAFSIPYGFVTLLISGIFIVGLISIFISTKIMLRRSYLGDLRVE
jgi:putative ABC transport system permease protein